LKEYLTNFNEEKRGYGGKDGMGKLVLTSAIKEEHLTQQWLKTSPNLGNPGVRMDVTAP